MATIASLNVNMTASTAQLRAGLDRATAQNRRFARTNQGIFGGLTRTLGGLRGIFATVFAGAGLAGASRLADTFTSVNNLLRASGVSAEDLADTFAQVQAVANGTRSELDATGRLFAVLTRNSAQLGVNQEEILLVTQAIQQAFAITGASAQEAAGATRQLAQALASGQLRGQELNSILEQGPRIAQTITDALGISLGELRELAAEGRITSDIIFQSILAGAQQIDTEFGRTSATFSQLSTVLRNQLAPAFGQLATDILPAVAASLQAVAGVIQILAPILPTLATVGIGLLIARFGRFAAILTGSVVGALRVARAEITAAQVAGVAYGAQLGTINTASARFALATGTATARLLGLRLGLAGAARVARVAALSVRAFSLVLAALGGPLGIAITGLSILATVLAQRYFAASSGATEQTTELDEALQNLNVTTEGIAANFEEAGMAGATAFMATRSELDALAVANGELSQAELDRVNALGRIGELLDNNAISVEQARAAILRINEAYAEQINEISEVGMAIETRIGDALADAFETGRFSLREFTADILRDIIRINARIAASNIASGLFGGSTGFFSGLFGGARQRGGPVQAGQAYVVGEAGPELFVPNASGNIVANDVIQGGEGGAGTNITINAVDTQSFQQALARDPRFIYNLTQRGARAQGV